MYKDKLKKYSAHVRRYFKKRTIWQKISAKSRSIAGVVDSRLASRIGGFRRVVYAFVAFLFFSTLVLMLSKDSGFHNFLTYFIAGYFLLYGALQISTYKSFMRHFEKYDPTAYWFPWYSSVHPYMYLVFGAAFIFQRYTLLISLLMILLLSVQIYGMRKTLLARRGLVYANFGMKYHTHLSVLNVYENAFLILIFILLIVV